MCLRGSIKYIMAVNKAKLVIGGEIFQKLVTESFMGRVDTGLDISSEPCLKTLFLYAGQ